MDSRDSRGQFFAFQHRIDIFRLNVTAFYQLFTGKANRFFFSSRGTAEEDVLRTQFKQVGITLVKAILQLVRTFTSLSS